MERLFPEKEPLSHVESPGQCPGAKMMVKEAGEKGC